MGEPFVSAWIVPRAPRSRGSRRVGEFERNGYPMCCANLILHDLVAFVLDVILGRTQHVAGALAGAKVEFDHNADSAVRRSAKPCGMPLGPLLMTSHSNPLHRRATRCWRFTRSSNPPGGWVSGLAQRFLTKHIWAGCRHVTAMTAISAALPDSMSKGGLSSHIVSRPE